jgi:uncharacterized coiled-coil protein SlyX
MNLESLGKLEERIARVIAHIDELSGRCKALEQENEEIKAQLKSLANDIRERDKTISRMEHEANRVTDKVKDKIDGLLTRIDNYEKKRT